METNPQPTAEPTIEELRKLADAKMKIDTETTKVEFLRLRELAYDNNIDTTVFDTHVADWKVYKYHTQELLLKTAILWLLHKKVKQVHLKHYAEKYLKNPICDMWNVNLKNLLYLAVSDIEVRQGEFQFDSLMHVEETVEDSVIRYYQMLLIVVTKCKMKEDITPQFAKMAINIMAGCYDDLQKIIAAGCSEKYLRHVKRMLWGMPEIQKLHKKLRTEPEGVPQELSGFATGILDILSTSKKK